MSSKPAVMHCPFCRIKTSITPAMTEYLAMMSSNISYTPAVWRDSGQLWWIGLCNSCSRPVLVERDGATIYPTPMPPPTDKRVPDNIRQDLDEAKRCFQVDAYRAAAVMARRAIQSAALEKGCKSGATLFAQIEDMAKKGIITADIKEWATAVREVGNDGSHPTGDPVSEGDAKDILQLAEQLFTVVYVAPAIAREMRQVRGAGAVQVSRPAKQDSATLPGMVRVDRPDPC